MSSLFDQILSDVKAEGFQGQERHHETQRRIEAAVEARESAAREADENS